ncbi:MAG: hypothetical protein ACOYXM_03795 [Actinomycetota bacterium]
MGRRTVRFLVVVALAALFAVAWRHEVFLVVIAMPAAAITLAVHERLADRSDARRAAALALTAPTGIADAAAFERIVVADLAAASLGDAEVIDRAASLAERTIGDPWRRALACERLLAARQMVSETSFAAEALAATILRRWWLRATAELVVIGTIAAAVLTGNRLLHAPLAVAFAAVALTSGELRRSDQLRELLVRQATTEPAADRIVVPDRAVTSAVHGLTAARPRVRRIAYEVVTTWPGPERAAALRRLGIPSAPRRTSRLDLEIAACAAVGATLTAVAEVAL